MDQYMSHNFVLAAGSVLFRQCPITGTLQICLLYHRTKQEWVLPKGRKDCGETMEAAAVRETYEETGYECELLPCRMPTRAPQVGTNTYDAVAMVDNITEPIAITVRDLGPGNVKMIWWFLTRVKSNLSEKVDGTQTDSEDYDSQFVDAADAVHQLSFQGYREVATQALNLVKDTTFS